jgi:putative ABC transport system ATP-binding protein
MALIDLREIFKVYDMGAEKVHALNGVDLQVDRGEYVAIMGSSGSGKSTLMNLVGCLDTPTSGSYILNGTAVQELDDTQLAGIRNKEIGFVFQTFNLLARTDALHNVELPLIYAGLSRSERRERAKKALEKVGHTVVLVTHEPDIAEHAWRRVMLRDGKVTSDQPTARATAAGAAITATPA